jgi:DNA-binding NarL/FixJ family response regulator
MSGNTLNSREAAIARLVAKGWSNRRIADQREMLEQSVKNTLTKVYRKLGIDNRVQLTLLVTRGKLEGRHGASARRRAE